MKYTILEFAQAIGVQPSQIYSAIKERLVTRDDDGLIEADKNSDWPEAVHNYEFMTRKKAVVSAKKELLHWLNKR